jgi:uncharacterized protein (UPF0276 family)
MNTRTSTAVTPHVKGAGLGLRRALLGPLADQYASPEQGIGFLEIAPENWMKLGGQYARQLRSFTERYPFVTHGLSLSIGSPAALDEAFVRDLKVFLDTHQIADYTEHLTFCSDDGHLYDLMPIPFTEEAVDYVAERVKRVQDILQRRIALENASYYTPLATDLSEAQFIRAVIEKADCDLLLDVNNIIVNSINHRYDPVAFLDSLPLERVRYLHLAGHYHEAEDLRVDTHGSDVDDPSWALLDAVYTRLGTVPTLLERDFNIPPLPELMVEIHRIHRAQQQAAQLRAAA